MFGLGIGIGETCVIGGFVYFIFGRRELVAFARTGGAWVGHFVGSLRATRSQIRQLSGTSDLSQLRADVQSGLHEIQQIRNEITAAGSIRGFAGMNQAHHFSSNIISTKGDPSKSTKSISKKTHKATASTVPHFSNSELKNYDTDNMYDKSNISNYKNSYKDKEACTQTISPGTMEEMPLEESAPTMDDVMRKTFSAKEYAAAVEKFSVSSHTVSVASGADHVTKSIENLNRYRSKI